MLDSHLASFCLADVPVRDDNRGYVIKSRLERGLVLRADLEEAVNYVGPRLVLQKRYAELFGEGEEDQPVRRLLDAMRPQMAVSGPWAVDVVAGLRGLTDRALEILEAATARLRSALALECDLELISREYDVNDFEVSSIEEHVQNEHQEGVSLLVRVLVDAIPGAMTIDHERTRRVVEGWRRLPGRIGTRLCLHALRHADLFSADSAMRALLELEQADFWTIRREVATLLRDRAGAASPSLVSEVEDRVCGTGETYYARFSIDVGQPDWRPHSRDTTVWLRLKMLEQAEAVSEKGLAELSNITQRREYLDREVEDRDYFGVYMYKPRASMGEAEPIAEQAPEDRLEVASELVHSPDPELGRSWWAYCRADPQGAYDLLRNEETTPAPGVLWNDFLNGLAFGYDATESNRRSLAVDALAYLRGTSNEVLEPMASGLADVLSVVSSTAVADLEIWLQRLWEVLAESPSDGVELTRELLNAAINSAPGKLVECLVRELERKHQACTAPTADELRLLAKVVSQDGAAGQLGRAILARNVAFLMVLPPDPWRDSFRARLMRCDEEGSALRTIMLEYGRLTPNVSVFLKGPVVQGVMESRENERQGAIVASKVLAPALSHFRGDSVSWGITLVEIETVLRDGPAAVRSGALRALLPWLERVDPDAASSWRELVGPLLSRIWPKEGKLLDDSTTQGFVDLVAATGEAFPEALDQLRHYILPFDESRGNLYSIKASGVAKTFPRETLDLVWRVCGPPSGRRLFDMADIIDQIVAADPVLETDRRLQWFELRAERYD